MLMTSLLKTTLQLYVWIGVFLFVDLLLYCDGSISYYNFLNVLLFMTYAILLWVNIGRSKEYYTYGRLAFTAFLYSIICVFLCIDMSIYYTGDTFYWDYTDPYQYFNLDEMLIKKDIPFYEIPFYLSSVYKVDFDDLGACLTQMLFLCIYPSRYFLFVSQTLVATLGAVLMFGTCKKIMQIDYAYLAALSYSVASFSIFYYTSYRKEVFMVFIVIAAFRCFYSFVEDKSKKKYLVFTVIVSLCMALYRPAIIVFMGAGMFSYFVMKEWGSEKMIPMMIVSLILVGISFSFVSSTADRYTNGGDLSQNENYVGATKFGIAVSAVGVSIGPFPQLLFLSTRKMSQLPLYGSGLLFKFFLFLAFWNGLVLCLKKKEADALPLFVFTILEMAALAVMNDGLELRKSMPHLSTFYMGAFWFLSKYDEQAVKENKMPILYPAPRARPEIVLFCTALFIIISSVIWNTR